MACKSRSLESKYLALQQDLSSLGSALVAFSGGVDSTLLLRVAKDALGSDVLAVTAVSATTARHEREDAIQLAGIIGVEHVLVDSRELRIPEFTSNPPDKCYVCKKSRFEDMVELARSRGVASVLDGENADDPGDYRPGRIATRELGVKSPLREAGLTKSEVRTLSKMLDLPTWSKPSYACLATRIPYGLPITEEKLSQIDCAEEFIRHLFPGRQVRVRHHGDIARIEIDPKVIAKLIKGKTRGRIIEHVKQLGFLHVSLDLEGYAMGSLNRAIQRES